jgi:hypothetical protein
MVEDILMNFHEDDDMTAPDDWLEENFGDDIRYEQQSLEEMQLISKCECGGDLEDNHDGSPDKVYNCEKCGEEYKYCGSCSHYYLAINWICPNDH